MIILYTMIIAVLALLAFYYYRRLKKQLGFFGFDPSERKTKIVSLIITAGVIIPCVRMFTPWPFIVLAIAIVFALTDVCAFIVRKIFKSAKDGSLYKALAKMYRYGIVALVILAIYFGYGVYNMNRIVPATYELEGTVALKSNLKVVLIADTHYGTIQDKDLLTREIKNINKLNPDIVILAGDITEENTSNKDMKRVFKELGGLKTKHGIYYVYGNHDKQNYTDNRTYSIEEYEQTIKSNGITLLEDQVVQPREDVLLAGRADMSEPSRKHISQLLDESQKKDKYMIIADHQPSKDSVQSEGTGGASLQVSGHTHGGQEFPIGTIMQLLGRWNYGLYTFDDLNVVVTSGFTGWGYPFRTQRHCEYALINIAKR